MSRRRDPRRAQGRIEGDDADPYGVENVFIDATDALLLEGCVVSLVGAIRDGLPSTETAIAIELDGRINKTTENVSVLCLTGVDGAAALVTQLIGLAARAGWRDEFMEIIKKRMEEMPT